MEKELKRFLAHNIIGGGRPHGVAPTGLVRCRGECKVGMCIGLGVRVRGLVIHGIK